MALTQVQTGMLADAAVTVAKLSGSGVPSFDGIKFPASQSASADANTLDDYEEGTWTPTLTTDGAAASVTYTVQSGKYTKVGNLVTVEAEISWSARSGGGGNVKVSGFPFGVQISSSLSCRLPLTYSSISTYVELGFFTSPANETSLYLYQLNNNNPIASSSVTGAGGVSFKSHYYIS